MAWLVLGERNWILRREQFIETQIVCVVELLARSIIFVDSKCGLAGAGSGRKRAGGSIGCEVDGLRWGGMWMCEGRVRRSVGGWVG